MSETTFETTLQRQAREQAEATERRHAEENARRERLNSEQSAAAWKETEAAREKQRALDAESEAANKAKRLRGEIEVAKGQLAGLKAEVATGREIANLPAEVEDLKKWIASNPLSSATPAQLDQITRLKLLIELWPLRKDYLAAQIPPAEQQLKNLEAEFAATQTLFQKAQAAAAKFFKRGDGGAA